MNQRAPSRLSRTVCALLPPILLPLLLPLLLSGCNVAEKMSMIGETPQLTQIQDPTRLKGYQPVVMPMPYPKEPPVDKSPSLWEDGAKAFFKDQRASKVGDVITVEVAIDQKESIEMKPSISRQNQSKNVVTNALGFERKAEKLFPKKQHPDGSANSTWLDVSSSPSLSGSAKYDINDKLNFKIAATIVQILPNGNMVIDGRQEIRVVNEVREIMIRGIVRRADVSAANVINWDKISELRISYGGRGDLSDMQRFPWGQEVMNKVLPF
jgi:flagellar L-ring protein precursor FlgH